MKKTTWKKDLKKPKTKSVENRLTKSEESVVSIKPDYFFNKLPKR